MISDLVWVQMVGWKAICVLDVLLDVLLFAMPQWILSDLQMTPRIELIITGAFTLRLPWVPAHSLRGRNK
jgi:hypothetical protein